MINLETLDQWLLAPTETERLEFRETLKKGKKVKHEKQMQKIIQATRN
ncbi:MAG: hypothetical protein WCP16_10485 [Pseudanabaena sp. ELA645]|jgi:hypothetical protein